MGTAPRTRLSFPASASTAEETSSTLVLCPTPPSRPPWCRAILEWAACAGCLLCNDVRKQSNTREKRGAHFDGCVDSVGELLFAGGTEGSKGGEDELETG